MNTKMANKEFIRFLKDIGLYAAYIQDKGDCGKVNLFSEFINYSFCWMDTKHQNLWANLHEISYQAEFRFNITKDNINNDKYVNYFKEKLF